MRVELCLCDPRIAVPDSYNWSSPDYLYRALERFKAMIAARRIGDLPVMGPDGLVAAPVMRAPAPGLPMFRKMPCRNICETAG